MKNMFTSLKSRKITAYYCIFYSYYFGDSTLHPRNYKTSIRNCVCLTSRHDGSCFRLFNRPLHDF